VVFFIVAETDSMIRSYLKIILGKIDCNLEKVISPRGIKIVRFFNTQKFFKINVDEYKNIFMSTNKQRCPVKHFSLGKSVDGKPFDSLYDYVFMSKGTIKFDFIKMIPIVTEKM
jgi:hypothetical protein